MTALAAASLALASLAQAADPPAQPSQGVARPRTCLVLSGGGARGVAHVGVLKVLEELRVPIDCIVGTSMGALTGGAYATGMSATEIERIVRGIHWDSVLADQPSRPERSYRDKELDRESLTRAEFGIRGTNVVLPLGALAGQQLETVLRSLAGGPIVRDSFDNLPTPWRAIATDAETGQMAVLDRGSVTGAMRASMSVPGVFSPQEIDGRLMIDGGLVRNLGVDVARSLGAERIIAVNLGTPLLKRAKLDSVLGITEQMVNILTEQNVQASIAQLRPDDILILPELADYSAADFEHSPATIEIGERAARKVADRLREWSVPVAEYRQYLARRERRIRDERYARVEIDTAGLKRVAPQTVIDTFDGATQGRLDDAALQKGLTALYATDDFDLVSLGVNGDASERTLVVQPREKRWGPNYARFGLTLSTDVAGETAFDFLGDYRMTWLNRRGLEWRSTFSLGTRNRLDTQLFQPIDRTRQWFMAGGLRLAQELDDLFVGDDALARYRNRLAVVHVDVGRYFGPTTEARIGYEYGGASFRRDSGATLVPTVRDDVGVVALSLAQDTFDDWDFPHAGHYLRASMRVALASLGDSRSYSRWRLDAQQAFSTGPHSLTLAAAVGDSSGADRIPPFETFALGGFQTLSGSADRQYLGTDLLFGRAVYRYRLGTASSSTRRLFVGGSVEAGRIQERINSTTGRDFRMAGSLFVAAGTPLGALYLAAGYTEVGNRAVYLFLGRP